MNKRPLEQLFFATFREKQKFSDFLELDINSAYSRKDYDGRSIYIPDKNLKLYLAFLSRVLFDRLPVKNDVVFSYRKGVNVVDAVEKHSVNRYFFQSDIKNFFGSIDRKLIGNTILSALDACPISDIEQWLDKILDLVTVDDALPPGFPTSPSISNACLYEFDKKLLTWCEENELIYTRYADDIIISGSVEEKMHLIIPKTTELLCCEFGDRVNLNITKTKFTRPGEKVKILGVAILPNGKVSVDGRLKKHSETAMHCFLKDKEKFTSFLKEKDFERALKKFSGQLNYINTVDPSFLDKLRKKYGATAVDKMIHISVGS
ncbi:reverse transcriptase domain-containing protein [Pseudomonas hefeiensis]|uniref:RNA-directed DNA polymerase n=1 Tax=Pseudomonas hefeiensis TaxID=2738125 RepID=A0ABY9GB68_9PSED|nr:MULTISPECIES: reverse transcriptase domain-containing protein [unclassified Pseudomonas]WLH12821.1 reverse transcriptase domain-containing protein [Pseudomonas sp. FP205]WLH95887.1 reverse transcriptase domain-containing protein [Pseudomonas sp. FP53]WLI40160.1 reverse transcriptase domain-containing protein [Pseudomonas sp. FP821]